MTGYGRSEAGGPERHVTLEVRSVNNRYLDVQVKMPRELAVHESRVKKTVQERFSRGRFDVFITRNGDRELSGKLMLDAAFAEQYITILRDLKDRFGLAGDVDLSQVAGVPGVIRVGGVDEDVDALWQSISEGLSRCLDDLDTMRSQEGAALSRDMTMRLDKIEGMQRAISSLAPASIENARKRMADTLARLMNDQPDPARLAQEIAFLAERTDITEELTRLSSHMAQFRALLTNSRNEAIGRKLDFLLQEMGREANTIASKAMDADISFDVVNIKAELEKIREQAQNIE